MRRRWVLIPALFIISIAVFAGGKQEPSKATIAILYHSAFIGDSESAWMRPQNREFEAANPGVRVVESAYGSDDVYAKFINSMLAGENAYDLVMTREAWTPEFASKGWIWEIPESKIPNAEDFIGREAVMIGSKWYGIPNIINFTTFNYNKKFLSAAGMSPPQSFDEWMDRSKKLTQDTNGDGINEIWGTVLEGIENQTFIYFSQFLWGFGGEFVTKSGGKYVIDWVNSPEAKAALQLMVDLYHDAGTDPGSVTYGSDESVALFGGGKAAFANLNSGRADRPEYISPGKPLYNANGTTILPGAVGSIKYPVANPRRSSSSSGTQGLAIASNSKVKEAALKLALWYAEPKNQKEMIVKRGYSVVRKSMISDAAFIKENEYVLAVIEQSKYVAPKLTFREPAVEAAMIPILEEARAKKMGVDEALKKMQEKVMQVLNE